jgi:hypothetical protein
MNEVLIDSSIGLIIGVSQTIIGYPFDTLKIHAQRGLPLKYNNLYAGAKYQLAISSINSAACYLAFDEVYEHTHNSVLAGAAAGITSGIIINPLEIYKLKHQVAAHTIVTPTHALRPTGLKFTVSREIIAFTMYFSTYMKLKEKSPDTVMLNGGLAGCASWCFSYPFDTMKTHHQTNNSSVTFKELWNKGVLFKGFGICMTRAFIVNAINFYIYETLHNIWNAQSI